jgi:hypothetical protein
MEKPIFILGSHKSGTSLLRSLLDGAQGLFVVPIEAHFFQYSGYWVDYALRRSLPRQLAFDEVVEGFTKHIIQSNERSSPTSDSVLTGCWNVDRFAHHLSQYGANPFEASDFRGFLDSYVEALHVSLHGSPPDAERFVEKSVENAEYAVMLKRLYPDARFVHVVRNPYATLVSLRKHMTRQHYPFLGNALASLENSYYYLYKNPMVVPDYLIVRYEDLLCRPQETMKQVSTSIEIEFTDALLRPSLMGKPWYGNSSSGRRFSGISSKPLDAWHEGICHLEVLFVNRYFGHILRDYDYHRLETRRPAYWPVLGESLKSYVANRAFWGLTQAAFSTSGLD